MEAEFTESMETRIAPRARWGLPDLGELWRYRDLLRFLIGRNILIVYRQTVLGLAWALLRPLLAMIIFSIVFGRMARLPSDGLPYPLFAYAALVPWTFFSGALTAATASLVGSAGIITKVYFSRLVMPLAAIIAGFVDFLIALALGGLLMAGYGVRPTMALLWLPMPMLLMVMTTVALGVWLSALAVQYRDVRLALPFLVQVLLYATPVVWPVSLVPPGVRFWYGLYPMVGVIEGMRAALFGHTPMPWDLIGAGFAGALALLAAGLVAFQRMDRRFADVI